MRLLLLPLLFVVQLLSVLLRGLKLPLQQSVVVLQVLYLLHLPFVPNWVLPLGVSACWSIHPR